MCGIPQQAQKLYLRVHCPWVCCFLVNLLWLILNFLFESNYHLNQNFLTRLPESTLCEEILLIHSFFSSCGYRSGFKGLVWTHDRFPWPTHAACIRTAVSRAGASSAIFYLGLWWGRRRLSAITPFFLISFCWSCLLPRQETPSPAQWDEVSFEYGGVV